jgi:hypothetical protein
MHPGERAVFNGFHPSVLLSPDEEIRYEKRFDPFLACFAGILILWGAT